MVKKNVEIIFYFILIVLILLIIFSNINVVKLHSKYNWGNVGKMYLNVKCIWNINIREIKCHTNFRGLPS